MELHVQGYAYGLEWEVAEGTLFRRFAKEGDVIGEGNRGKNWRQWGNDGGFQFLGGTSGHSNGYSHQ